MPETTATIKPKKDYWYRFVMWTGLANDQARIQKVASRHSGALLRVFNREAYLAKFTGTELATMVTTYNKKRPAEQAADVSRRINTFKDQWVKQVTDKLRSPSYATANQVKIAQMMQLFSTPNDNGSPRKVYPITHAFFDDAHRSNVELFTDAAVVDPQLFTALQHNRVFKEQWPNHYAGLIATKLLNGSLQPSDELFNVLTAVTINIREVDEFKAKVVAATDVQLSIHFLNFIAHHPSALDAKMVPGFINALFGKEDALLTIKEQADPSARFLAVRHLVAQENTKFDDFVAALTAKNSNLEEWLSGFSQKQINTILERPKLTNKMSSESLVKLALAYQQELFFPTVMQKVIEILAQKTPASTLNAIIAADNTSEALKKMAFDAQDEPDFWLQLSPSTRLKLIEKFGGDKFNELKNKAAAEDKNFFVHVLINDASFEGNTNIEKRLALFEVHSETMSDVDITKLQKDWKITKEPTQKKEMTKMAILKVAAGMIGEKAFANIAKLFKVDLMNVLTNDDTFLKAIYAKRELLISNGLTTEAKLDNIRVTLQDAERFEYFSQAQELADKLFAPDVDMGEVLNGMTPQEKTFAIRYLLEEDNARFDDLLVGLQSKEASIVDYLGNLSQIQIEQILEHHRFAEKVSAADLVKLTFAYEDKPYMASVVDKVKGILPGKETTLDAVLLSGQSTEYLRKRAFDNQKTNRKSFWRQLVVSTRSVLIAMFGLDEGKGLDETKALTNAEAGRDKDFFVNALVIADPNLLANHSDTAALVLFETHKEKLTPQDVSALQSQWANLKNDNQKLAFIKWSLKMVGAENGISPQAFQMIFNLFNVNLLSFKHDTDVVKDIFAKKKLLIECGVANEETFRQLAVNQAAEVKQTLQAEPESILSRAAEAVKTVVGANTQASLPAGEIVKSQSRRVRSLEEFSALSLSAMKDQLMTYQDNPGFIHFLNDNIVEVRIAIFQRILENQAEPALIFDFLNQVDLLKGCKANDGQPLLLNLGQKARIASLAAPAFNTNSANMVSLITHVIYPVPGETNNFGPSGLAKVRALFNQQLGSLEGIANVLLENRADAVFLQAFVSFLASSGQSLSTMIAECEKNEKSSTFLGFFGAKAAPHHSPEVKEFVNQLLSAEHNEHVISLLLTVPDFAKYLSQQHVMALVNAAEKLPKIYQALLGIPNIVMKDPALFQALADQHPEFAASLAKNREYDNFIKVISKAPAKKAEFKDNVAKYQDSDYLNAALAMVLMKTLASPAPEAGTAKKAVDASAAAAQRRSIVK